VQLFCTTFRLSKHDYVDLFEADEGNRAVASTASMKIPIVTQGQTMTLIRNERLKDGARKTCYQVGYRAHIGRKRHCKSARAYREGDCCVCFAGQYIMISE
jgi:hypothetical protein